MNFRVMLKRRFMVVARVDVVCQRICTLVIRERPFHINKISVLNKLFFPGLSEVI